jgi:hypothetical protein
MEARMVRVTALVLALMISGSALAKENVLRPSARALAAASGGDDPPPHASAVTLRRPPPKAAVVEDDSPVYKKWWFWVLTAAVVGGTVAYGALTFKAAEPRPRACPPTTRVCFGDGRPL